MRREGVLQPFFVPTRWDPNTCSCGCPKQEFGEEEEACQEGGEGHWDQSTCQCHPRRMRVSEIRRCPIFSRWQREGWRHSSSTTPAQTCHVCTIHQGCQPPITWSCQLFRMHYRSLDIAGWVLLGSCISLVIILGGTTWHYRWSITLFSMRFLLKLVPFPKLP